jgi:hypothetical protein
MTLLLFAVAIDVKSYLSRLFSPENLPNIGLLLAGIVGIVVAIRTLTILGRQTTAIEKQGDALISSERAWVIAELVPTCIKVGNNWYRMVIDGHVALSDEEILNGAYMNHVLKLTNMGRTPALILSYELDYSCLGEGVTTLRGGAIQMQRSQRLFEHVLGAGESTEAPEPVNVYDYIWKGIEEINKLKNTAVFHGRVKYMHVFSKTEVMQVDFCYVYRPSLSRLEKAPPEKAGLEQNE